MKYKALMSKTFLRIKHAVKYLVLDPLYFFIYIVRYWDNSYSSNAKFMSNEEFRTHIREGKSVLRLGDGEISFIHYNTSNYEPFSKKLRNKIISIIRQYSLSSSFILGVPLYINKTNSQLDAEGANLKRIYIPFKITFDMLFNKKAVYFDAHTFYHNETIAGIVAPYLETKKVIFVSHHRNILDFKATGLARTLQATIICPETSAFGDSERIVNEILDIIKSSNASQKDFVVLLAAGLVKTIVADERLSGVQILDIGNGFEGYKLGVSAFTFVEENKK